MDINPAVLLVNLEEDIGHLDGELEVYRANVLKKTLFRKYVESKKQSVILDEESKKRFLELNKGVSKAPLEYSALLGQWREQIRTDLINSDATGYKISLNAAVGLGSCGPGASIDAIDNSFLSKLFESPITYTTPFLLAHFRAAISGHWINAIRDNPSPPRMVRGNRLSSVPKNKDTNRTTCTEPSLNMYYQLGIKHIVEQMLIDRYSLHVGGERQQQEINKRLARRSSRDSSLATIDLKDASDTISLPLIRFLYPQEVVTVLERVRSPETQAFNEWHELNMLSTMGNGFTFPIMTHLFASLLRVLYRNNNLAFTADTFGVFGDDIICLSEVYEEVVALLESVGFRVNLDKSFHTGFFRESCGGDYYHGFDVRGIYIKRIENEADIYSVFNRLVSWSLRHNISIFRTLNYIKGLAKFQPVPRYSGVHEGYIVPFRNLLCPKRDRNGCIYYKSTDFMPQRRRITDDTTNPFGALICALGGYITQVVKRRPKTDVPLPEDGGFRKGYVVDLVVPLRPQSRRVRVVRRRTPNWDSVITGPDLHKQSRKIELEGRGLEILDRKSVV